MSESYGIPIKTIQHAYIEKMPDYMMGLVWVGKWERRRQLSLIAGTEA